MSSLVTASNLINAWNLNGGSLDAAFVGTIQGLLVDVNAVYSLSNITGLGNEAIILEDTILTASQLNTLDGNTSGTVDAGTVTTLSGSASDLITAYASGGITGLGNEAVSVSSGTASTSQANTLAAATSGVVTATLADGDLSTLAGLTETGNAYTITITDTSVDAAALNTLDGKTTVAIDASNITTLTGAAADLNTAYAANGSSITGLGNEAATLSDTNLAVSVLNTLDGNTTGVINASNITTLTSDDYDSLNTAYTSANGGAITGLGDEAISVSGRIRVSEANTLNGHTTGVITATVTNSDGTDNLNISSALSLNGTGNAYSIRIKERTVSASDLLTVDAITTTTVNARNIRTLEGTYTEVIDSYAAETAGRISGLGSNCNFNISGAITVAEANTLSTLITDSNQRLTATISDGDMATLAGISESDHNLTITITDSSVDAAALNTLDGKTTVAIDASNITTLTGAAADLSTAYASSGITGLDDENITLSDTTLAVSVLNTLDSNTSGTIDAGTVTTLTGAAAEANTAYASAGISNLGNEAVTLSDTNLAVSVLNTLDGNTSGTVDAGTVTTLTGAAADLNTAYDSGGISNLGNEAVTLSDTTLAASVLNTLDGSTTGTINANTITTLTGSASDLITAYASGGISNLGDEAVSVSSGNASTSQANTLAAATSGVVTATLSDGDLSTLAGLTETGNAYSITITDTSVDAAALNTLDGKTTVAIDASNITTLTGAAADLNTAYTSAGITGLDDENITLSDATLAVSVLNTLDGNTSGAVNAANITTLTGAAADLNTAYDSSGISNLGDEDVNLTDTSLSASVLNTLDGNTSGTVNANTVSTLSGAAADLNTAYSSSGISNLGDEDVTLTDTSLAASVLNTLDGNTSGTVNANTVTTLTGAAADLNTAYTSAGITGLANEADTVRPTIAITDDDADNSLSAGDTATLTFTLSEAATDFVEADVAVSGGSLSNWTAVSSTVYSATFTPTDDSTSDGVISVASSKFSDAAGNNNLDGADANNSVTFTVDTTTTPTPSPTPPTPPDTTPPTIAITDDDADNVLSAGDTATLTFTLSETSFSFFEYDVSVTGGSLSNWNAVSNTVYTATFTPDTKSTTDGVIHVANDKFFDLSSNYNQDETDANNTVTFTVDTVRPTIAITDDDADNSLSAGDTATLTFTLSEASTNFIESDVSVTGGSLSNWNAVSRTVYTATFTPVINSTANGVIHVANDKFSDAGGNTNKDETDANNTVTFTVDTTTTPSPEPSPEPSPSPTLTPEPSTEKSDLYLLLDTSTSMLTSGSKDRRKHQSLLALKAISTDIERAGYQFQHRDTSSAITSTQLLQKLAKQNQTQSIQELDNYTIIDNPNDANNADEINIHLIKYCYCVQHDTFTLSRTNPNSGIGTMQSILSLKMAGEDYGNSIKNNSDWTSLGLPDPNRNDLYQGNPDTPSNLYAGTELLGAMEGLDYLLNQKANDTNQRDQSTSIALILDGRPERRSWWDTRTNAASDSITGQAIPLPESLGQEDITTSGLLYDTQGNPHFFKNNQGQWQWKEMQNDLNDALDRLAAYSTDPAATIQVNAYGLNNTGSTSLDATYQDLFSNQSFDNSSSSWSYAHHTIQSLQDLNL